MGLGSALGKNRSPLHGPHHPVSHYTFILKADCCGLPLKLLSLLDMPMPIPELYLHTTVHACDGGVLVGQQTLLMDSWRKTEPRILLGLRAMISGWPGWPWCFSWAGIQGLKHPDWTQIGEQRVQFGGVLSPSMVISSFTAREIAQGCNKRIFTLQQLTPLDASFLQPAPGLRSLHQLWRSQPTSPPWPGPALEPHKRPGDRKRVMVELCWP